MGADGLIGRLLAVAFAVAGLLSPIAVSGESFVLEGHAPLPRERFLSLAEQAARNSEAWFEVELKRPVVVRWLTDPQEIARFSGAGEVAGVAIAARNTVALMGPAFASHPERIRPVLFHEMCHLAFARATANAEVEPPRWLNEGLAMRISGDWDLGFAWSSSRSELLADAVAANSLIPLERLEVSFPAGPFFHLAYAQSFSFVDWLAGREGDEGLRDLVAAFDDDLDPEPAFRSVYGMSLAEAEKEWRASISRGGWLDFLPSARTLFASIWVLLGLLIMAKFVQTRIRLRRLPEDDASP